MADSRNPANRRFQQLKGGLGTSASRSDDGFRGRDGRRIQILGSEIRRDFWSADETTREIPVSDAKALADTAEYVVEMDETEARNLKVRVGHVDGQPAIE